MYSALDKRVLARSFRQRLQQLTDRSGLSRAAFAESVEVDRSALTQMLSSDATRLPRADTLIRMAAVHGVSLDWLLGLSQDEGVSATIKPALELEQALDGRDRTLLNEWHTEARGTKIRYVPTTIPDILRTERIMAHEAREQVRPVASRMDEAHDLLDDVRKPESDMEVCMPIQTLRLLAGGQGVWTMLTREERRKQIDHMANLVEDLYPSLRLYLFDSTEIFAAPYTVFGHHRAAIYMGDMYIVLNSKEAISALTGHFDRLVRAAKVHAHETSEYIGRLRIL